MSGIDELTLEIHQSVTIQADAQSAWNAMVRRITSENATPDNTPMPMVLEQWPGGRWYRDLGDDQGHLWGFVQVIKAPTLIEIHGPLFMSYAVAGHVQLRLTPLDEGIELSLHHRVLGVVEEDHRAGVTSGWQHMLDCIKKSSE